MTFPHPVSSNLDFKGGEDSIDKSGEYTTYQFAIRLIRVTEARKIVLHLDPTSGIGDGATL